MVINDLPPDVREQVIKELPTNVKEQLRTGLPIILRPVDSSQAAISIVVKPPGVSRYKRPFNFTVTWGQQVLKPNLTLNSVHLYCDQAARGQEVQKTILLYCNLGSAGTET
jgi:hypothetical protein